MFPFDESAPQSEPAAASVCARAKPEAVNTNNALMPPKDGEQVTSDVIAIVGAPVGSNSPAGKPETVNAATSPWLTKIEVDGTAGQKPILNVLVIDDELTALTSAHMREYTADFFAEIADINSETTEAVWEIVRAQVAGKKPYDAVTPNEVADFFASQDFISVVLSEAMRNAEFPAAGMLTSFHEYADSVTALRKLIEMAYPEPDFKLTFQATRPEPPNALRAYDLVILDLVLANSAAAVDELVTYLKRLANDTAPLPCLIVLSSREEMIDNRPRFSSDSQISAAGLLLLQKREVRKQAFGVVGLQLSYEQLNRQRSVAQHTRVFVRAWIEGLAAGQQAASQTLWNLDAAAMQEIHLSANSDDDPYDAHLNELVAREYLWHVEGVEAVATAVEDLDLAFQSHLKSDGKKISIGERFVAPYADPKPGRNLVSHYNWTGFKPIGSLRNVSANELARKFNRLVPFGAVIAPETLAVGTQCWVHITQQCDLNGSVRVVSPGEVPNSSLSATLAMATAIEVNDRTVPTHDTQDLVARGLRVDEQEFDLRFVSGRTVSVPINLFIKLARRKGQRVVGRLRHDIATQFLNATANHMTRPAQLKATRVQMRPGRLYLWGKGYNCDKPLGYLNEDGDIRTLQVAFNDKQCYLADEASLPVALWLAEEARAKLGKSVDTTKLYNLVRGGMTKNGNVVSVINLRIEEGAFANIDGYFRNGIPDKPTLILFTEVKPT